LERFTMPARRSATTRRTPSAHERQRDAERSRERLLEAALDVFSARGFAGGRVQEIADRAGVNAQLISYYFGGKEGLYRALQQLWLDSEAGFNDPDAPLEELVGRYLHATLADPRLARLLLWAGLSEPVADAPRPVTDDREEELADVRRRQARGELASEFDPGMIQLIMMGVLLAPIALPQVTRELTGLDPADPKFERRFAEQLKLVARRLAE
jgi:TetR/AcrR family transcriptional regulator